MEGNRYVPHQWPQQLFETFYCYLTSHILLKFSTTFLKFSSFLSFTVVLDRRENRGCDTGRFELAYRENPLHASKCVETKFLLEGNRIRRQDLQRYSMLDQRFTKQEKDKEERARRKEMEKNGELPPKEEKPKKPEEQGAKSYSVKELEDKARGRSDDQSKSESEESEKKEDKKKEDKKEEKTEKKDKKDKKEDKKSEK